MTSAAVSQSGIKPTVFEVAAWLPPEPIRPEDNLSVQLAVARYSLEVATKELRLLRSEATERPSEVHHVGTEETTLSLRSAESDDFRIAAERLGNRVRRLRNLVKAQHIERLYAAAASTKSRKEIKALRVRVREAEKDVIDALVLGTSPDPFRNAKPRSVKDALGVAGASHVLSIPASVADRAVAALDESGRRKARGRSVLAALSSMHAYGIDARRSGDFKQWLAAGGPQAAVATTSVAMQESVSVRRDAQMAAARLFPVDTALDPSGRRMMLAHIKLDRGPTAPRLYFLDDTSGETGKVHIGYIGPHLATATDPT